MSMDPTLVRRIMGTATVVLVIALSYVVLEARFAPPAGSYEVTADLGRAGSGLREGTDVKTRGVNIGEVTEVRYEEGRALATLTLESHPPLPPPDELEMVVTAKTLLGEKQVEITFDDERYGQEPFLEAGDTIPASREPTELSEAIDAMEPFIAAVDPQDLATIVDTLGAQQGEGERIAENLEVSQELFAFGAETADDTLDRLNSFSDIAEALAPATDDLGRMNRTLPDATALLVERQAEIRSNLETVSRAATTVSAFLETEEQTLSRFLTTSRPVGDVIQRQADHIGGLVEGAALYMESLGKGGMLLDDGTEWAGFRIFLIFDDDEGGFDFQSEMCEAVPDLPSCGGDA
jgi:phospholipid/cholesterol/gamma-HCH transport system substrate-binding protein